MVVRINLNETVKFKLGDTGREIFYHQYDEWLASLPENHPIRKTVIPHYPKEDENGYVEMQLWECMRLFGPHFRMGYQDIIIPLEILYEDEFAWG